MTPAALISELSRQGVRLWGDGGTLRYKGPSEALTLAVKAGLAAHKSEILTLLAEDATTAERSAVKAEPNCATTRKPWDNERARQAVADCLEGVAALYAGSYDRDAFRAWDLALHLAFESPDLDAVYLACLEYRRAANRRNVP